MVTTNPKIINAPRKSSLDPTKTATLRRAFRASASMNLRSLRADLRQVVVDMDLLGLETNVNKSVFAFQTPAQRLQQFTGWLETAALASLDAHWWAYPFINKALASGLYRASQEVSNSDYYPQPDTFAHLHALAKSEVRGIIAAMVQKTTRVAHTSMVRGVSPPVSFTEMAKGLDGEFKNRLAFFTHFITVKAHAQAKLAVYRANGIKKIGIDPETHFVPKDHLVRDDQSENYVVGWGTAGDELVCDECDEMAQGSPYTIDDIEDMFPLHVNCRCAPYPWPADEDSGEIDDAQTVVDEESGHPFRGNQYAQGEAGGAAHPESGKTVHLFHATLSPNYKPGEGAHFGTKEAAEQRVKDLLDLPPESRPILTPRDPQPTMHEVQLRLGRVIELKDPGEWSSIDIAHELREKGVMSPQEFDGLKAKEFDFDHEEFLRGKGYDTIAYRNSWENKGSYSYIPLRGENIRHLSSKRFS